MLRVKFNYSLCGFPSEQMQFVVPIHTGFWCGFSTPIPRLSVNLSEVARG